MQVLPALTSLRFVAALMVVTFHATNYFAWPTLKHRPDTFFHGVSFFFVLSGFILTHVYRSRPWPGYWRFLALRAGRLWPVHAIALVFLLVAATFGDAIMRPQDITYSGTGFLSPWVSFGLVATMTQSLSPYIPHSFGWNAPSWSISTEFSFYVLFPFLLINIERTWFRNLLVSAIVVLLFLCALYFSNLATWNYDRSVLTKASIAYASPAMRLFEFCLGMACWVIWDRYIRKRELSFLWWSVLEIGALALVVWWLTSDLFMRISAVEFLRPWFYSAASCWVFAVLIVVVASGRGLLGKLLSLSPFVFLGEVSYSLYLFHVIVICVLFRQGMSNLGPAYVFALLLALACANFLLIERPCRSWVAGRVAGHGAPRPASPAARTAVISGT